MKSKTIRPFFITISVAKFVRTILVFLSILIFLFSTIGGITALKPQYRLSSSYINQFFERYEGKLFLFFLEQENEYFGQLLSEKKDRISWSKVFMELSTNVNLSDPVSLLGSELPGFRNYDIELVTKEKGTNYANISYESSPPLDIFENEPEVIKEIIENTEPNKPNNDKPLKTTNGKKVVYIYHTHTRESFKPILDPKTKSVEAYNSRANISLVGKKLGEELEKRGIGTIVDLTDFTKKQLDQGLAYAKAYDVSRKTVVENLKKNRDIDFVFDIHRDAIKKELTTIKIKETNYARIVFVVGGDNEKYEKNLKFATDLHSLLNQRYPGISRNVVVKRGAGVNGVYNQDLMGEALTVEIGGIENNLHELYSTTEVLSEIVADYYWKK